MNRLMGNERGEMSDKHLTILVHLWLDERNLRATTAKKWQRHESKGNVRSYWWNYFRVNGNWWGFNVYDDEKVERLV